MAMDFNKVVTGVRNALYGREVREWIAQCVIWVKEWMEEKIKEVEQLISVFKNWMNYQMSLVIAYVGRAETAAGKSEQSAYNASVSATNASSSATAASQSAKDAADSVTKANRVVADATKGFDEIYSLAESAAYQSNHSAEEAAASATAAKNCTGGYYADYSLTIPVSAWGYNTMTSSTFAYEAKISVADCTSDMIPLGSIELGSYETARAAGMACMCYADNNCVRFFAQEKPTAEIKMQVSILAHMTNISAYLDIDRATDAEINELIETYFGKEG
jgi:hypothetical protein